MSLIALVVRPGFGLFLVWLGILAFGTVVAYLARWHERHAIVELRLESNRLTAWWLDGRISSHSIEAVSEVIWTTTTDHPWEVKMVLRIDGRRCHTRPGLESETRRLRGALRAAGVKVTFEEPFVLPATTM